MTIAASSPGTSRPVPDPERKYVPAMMQRGVPHGKPDRVVPVRLDRIGAAVAAPGMDAGGERR